MVIKTAPDIQSSEITPRALYLRRREFLQAAATGAVGAVAGIVTRETPAVAAEITGRKLEGVKKGPFGTDEQPTPYNVVTTYNNFYEFGTDKDEPARSAKTFRTRPWTIQVDGEVNKKGAYHLEDFVKPYGLEERVYRHRCVEGWSIVVPWIGFPLADVIKQVEPTSKAKFVEFTTLYDLAQMPGQRRDVLRWPYVEGLRLDEAMHPLTILAVGLYGEVLPNQNGAPLRLIVPWKYGFKSIKSIVKMRFMEKQPLNSWQLMTPNEYGFYANVNPQVDHPRWTQAKERRLGEFFKRPTLMSNAYADQVASLYSGMNLRRYC